MIHIKFVGKFNLDNIKFNINCKFGCKRYISEISVHELPIMPFLMKFRCRKIIGDNSLPGACFLICCNAISDV